MTTIFLSLKGDKVMKKLIFIFLMMFSLHSLVLGSILEKVNYESYEKILIYNVFHKEIVFSYIVTEDVTWIAHIFTDGSSIVYECEEVN